MHTCAVIVVTIGAVAVKTQCWAIEQLSSAMPLSEGSLERLLIFIFSFSFERLIFSQKSILIDLLNQASFSSLKLLPFDNILIVT